MSTQRPNPILAALAALLLAAAAAAAQTTPSQATRTDLVTLTAEVQALDPATREITLLGPLGGTIEAVVSDQVKNLAQVKVGDLVEITYYQSVTVSAHKVGEPNPLFTGGDDGDGFDRAAQRERRSLGLASMRERIELVRGRLEIDSAPGRGTAVLAWVPLEGCPE